MINILSRPDGRPDYHVTYLKGAPGYGVTQMTLFRWTHTFEQLKSPLEHSLLYFLVVLTRHLSSSQRSLQMKQMPKHMKNVFHTSLKILISSILIWKRNASPKAVPEHLHKIFRILSMLCLLEILLQ